MKKMFLSIKTGHLFCIGLIVLALSLIPTLILGTDSVVYYHDQLDGELIAYIYQAKYLFSGSDILPEFLNGASKATLTPPAPLAVLLFAIFSPFTAYSILQIGVQIVAYVGMFFLIKRMTQNSYISLLAALLYTFLPFLPLYGLAQYGIPLLLLCFWNLYEGKYIKSSIIYVGIYATMSSLVLVGFAWLFIGAPFVLYLAITGKLKKQLPLLTSLFVMLCVYIIENISLIKQILGIGSNMISHKESYVISSAPLFSQFWSFLTSNTSHSTDHHVWILFISIGAIVFFLLTRRSTDDNSKKSFKVLTLALAAIVLICLLAALWSIPAVTSIREQFGALKAFSFSRILWLTPALWYIALANALYLLLNTKGYRIWLTSIFTIAIMSILCLNCFKTSFIKPNVQELLLPNYNTITWSDYFALGVMDQVENYISQEEGLEQHEYKVASLGIDPSAALLHGFYCVDGYSNNYPLEYKTAFRQVIAKEIDKSEWLKAYFDDWGNRCYLLSSELYGYYNVEKNSFWYNSLELNTDALKQLGCDYILSAAYIVPAEDMNLSLLGEFETPESYYKIFLYKIN